MVFAFSATAKTPDLHLIQVQWFGVPPPNSEHMPAFLLVPRANATDLHTATDMSAFVRKLTSPTEGFQCLDHLCIAVGEISKY